MILVSSDFMVASFYLCGGSARGIRWLAIFHAHFFRFSPLPQSCWLGTPECGCQAWRTARCSSVCPRCLLSRASSLPCRRARPRHYALEGEGFVCRAWHCQRTQPVWTGLVGDALGR